MSDQLLVTGLAFIISGYFQIQYGLSIYHWQLITKLVWFSSITHIATLMCLEQYFQKHQYIWYARLILMTGLAVMLAVGIASTGDSRFIRSDGYIAQAPALCLFDIHDYSFSWQESCTMLISEIMLIGGLIVRVVQMFPASKKICSAFLAGSLIRWRAALVWCCGKSQKSCRCVQTVSLSLVTLALAVSLSVQSILDFVRSRIFGVSQIILDRPLNALTGK